MSAMNATLTWTSADQHAQATVSVVGIDAFDGKFQIAYSLRCGDDALAEVAHGDDLRIANFNRPVLTDALITLALFLSAWDEALDWGARSGGVSENEHLFPLSAMDWRPWIEEFALDMTLGGD